jgi:hypothetical protein
MQRFRRGDRILILPKFSHLYPGTHGTVINVTPDPFRPAFTEYTIIFADGSKAELFEFQLLEEVGGYHLLIADITFDSSQNPLDPSGHARPADQQLILQAGTIDIDITIHRMQFDATLTGRISERQTGRFFAGAQVSLMKLSTPINTAATDASGTFRFRRVFPGKLNIDVLIPSESLRIFGTIVV